MASGHFYTSYRSDQRLFKTGWMRFWTVVSVALLVYLPFVLTTRTFLGINLSYSQLLGMSLVQVNFALVAIIGAVALNLLTGYTGLISIGSAGFFAVGAFAGGVFGVQWGWPFPLVLLLSGVLGAGIGALVGLPSLRVRGLYLLLATLGFHFISAYLFLRYQVKYFGPFGISYEDPSLFGWAVETDTRWYFLLVALTAVAIVVTKNVLRTREGRAFIAIRDRDIAAASAGVNLAKTKLKAFAFSSFLLAVAGTLYSYYLSNATADIFTLGLAIDFVAMIIIGGMGSITGAVMGALLWQLLPQVIQTIQLEVGPEAPVAGDFLQQHAAQLQDMLLGLIIILILVFKPDGLNGIWVSTKRFFQRWPYTT
ncbi:MAG: branched-chain amino acid ABC transporter permease [Acidimicrobiales bacterium]